MSLVLVVQLQGQGARNLSADEHKAHPDYDRDLHCMLEELQIPIPQTVVPVWKSGVIKCIYVRQAISTVCMFSYCPP